MPIVAWHLNQRIILFQISSYRQRAATPSAYMLQNPTRRAACCCSTSSPAASVAVAASAAVTSTAHRRSSSGRWRPKCGLHAPIGRSLDRFSPSDGLPLAHRGIAPQSSSRAFFEDFGKLCVAMSAAFTHPLAATLAGFLRMYTCCYCAEQFFCSGISRYVDLVPRKVRDDSAHFEKRLCANKSSIKGKSASQGQTKQ